MFNPQPSKLIFWSWFSLSLQALVVLWPSIIWDLICPLSYFLTAQITFKFIPENLFKPCSTVYSLLRIRFSYEGWSCEEKPYWNQTPRVSPKIKFIIITEDKILFHEPRFMGKQKRVAGFLNILHSEEGAKISKNPENLFDPAAAQQTSSMARARYRLPTSWTITQVSQNLFGMSTF